MLDTMIATTTGEKPASHVCMTPRNKSSSQTPAPMAMATMRGGVKSKPDLRKELDLRVAKGGERRVIGIRKPPQKDNRRQCRDDADQRIVNGELNLSAERRVEE